MKANELLRKLRAHRGKLYVPVMNAHGAMHVAAEKSDLIWQMQSFAQSQGDVETGYEIYLMDDQETWVFGADHNAKY